MPTIPRILLFAPVLLTALVAEARGDDPPLADVVAPPLLDEFVVIPLRVHVLTAVDLPSVDCHLSYADVARVVAKANGIWHKAGIHWGLESVVREPAAKQNALRLSHDLDGPRALGLYRLLRPETGRAFDGLHVYYVHELPVNGVWMGSDYALVKETARLSRVEGGIDEPLPRVTAHELGHALGLPHRQDRTNLLASGTTGTLLNAREVEIARTKAREIPGAQGTPALRDSAREAESRGDLARARRGWSWIEAVPGGEAEASAALGRLGRSPRPAAGSE